MDTVGVIRGDTRSLDYSSTGFSLWGITNNRESNGNYFLGFRDSNPL